MTCPECGIVMWRSADGLGWICDWKPVGPNAPPRCSRTGMLQLSSALSVPIIYGEKSDSEPHGVLKGEDLGTFDIPAKD